MNLKKWLVWCGDAWLAFVPLVVLAAGVLIATPTVAAEVREAWVQRYNSVTPGGNDFPVEVVRDAAGDYIVTGGTDNHTTGHDILTIKYSGTNGAIIWHRRYDGAAHLSDSVRALALDRQGNAIIAGYSSNGTNTDWYTAKISGADGAVLWEQRYAGPANGSDTATAVTVDDQGNVLVTGSSSTFATTNQFYVPETNDFYTAKYAAADGALLWERHYNGPANANDVPQAIAVDDQGNVVVTGSSAGAGTDSDFYTAMYAATDGALIWERRHEGSPNASDGAQAVTIDQHGDVLITGHTARKIAENRFERSDLYTAKYSATDGTTQWERRYNGEGNATDGGMEIVTDVRGDVIVTGNSRDSRDNTGFYTAKYAADDGSILWERWSTNGGTMLGLDGQGNVAVAGGEYTGGAYAATYSGQDGSLLWERSLRNGQWDTPVGLAVSGDGEVAVTRVTRGDSHKDHHWFTTKMANDGLVLWQEKFDGPANGSDRALGLVIDRDGNVAVTGTSVTAKYAAGDGTLLWKKRQAELIGVDGNDNVILVGSDWGESLYDLWIHKYSPAGDLLWEQHYEMPRALYDQPVKLIVDRDGNLILTGWSYRRQTDARYVSDYFTAKYSGQDGTLIWERFYNGPGDGEDRASAAAIDHEGNVIVTGSAVANPTNGTTIYYTSKYAGTDGTLMWGKEYHGPTNTSDSAKAIAVDGNGNVIVTGSAHNGRNTDYATVKYAAADGALVWERRFNGPGSNSDDEPTAVTVDANGDVFLTGLSLGTDRISEFYTAKYRAADGALVWENRYVAPEDGGCNRPLIVLHGDGNPIISGDANGSYYTAKYSSAEGAVIWEKRLDVPPNRYSYVFGLSVGPDGMVAVTGHYFASFVQGVLPDFDYVTVVYRENQAPAIVCPSNAVVIAAATTGAPVEFTINATDDSGTVPNVVCVPTSGAVFPIGQSAVTCTATDGDGLTASCSFTVTVQGAQAARRSVLEDLKALRATISDRETRWRLDAAIAHLTSSLSSEFWLSETHLQRKHGDRVFQLGLSTVRNLCQLTRDRKSGVSDAVVEGFVDRLVRADRLLAIVAIEDAVATGVREQKIEQAQKWVARGDADAAHELCRGGLQEYRQAWKRVARPSVVPVRHRDGRVRLEIAAEPSDRLVIQASSNLRDWATLGRCIIGSDGLANHDDREARGQGARFYRVVDE